MLCARHLQSYTRCYVVMDSMMGYDISYARQLHELACFVMTLSLNHPIHHHGYRLLNLFVHCVSDSCAFCINMLPFAFHAVPDCASTTMTFD